MLSSQGQPCFHKYQSEPLLPLFYNCCHQVLANWYILCPFCKMYPPLLSISSSASGSPGRPPAAAACRISAREKTSPLPRLASLCHNMRKLWPASHGSREIKSIIKMKKCHSSGNLVSLKLYCKTWRSWSKACICLPFPPRPPTAIGAKGMSEQTTSSPILSIIRLSCTKIDQT